jgi:hemolysin activation/secretion protein
MRKPLLCLVAVLSIWSADLYAQEEAVPRFEIRRYVLEGNTLLPADKVAEILAKHTGKERDFGDIQQTIELLEGAYRSSGYTLTTVILPEQELTRGEVRLRVIESRVKEIRIEGNKFFSNNNILASLPTLKTGESPRVAAISENLRAANENPFRKITLQFTALTNPEDLKASLDVKDQKPWRVALDVDNTGNRQSGRYRTGVSLQHGNLFDLDHMAILQYTTSPDHIDRVNTISGSYRIPIYRLGDTFDMFGAYSDVNSGTSQISGTDLTIKGKGIVSGFRYNLGLPRSGEYEQKLALGMDYRLYKNSAQMFGVDLAPDVVAHPFSATYNGTLQHNLLTLDFYGGVLHNEPWGGQGQQSDFTAVRNSAAADYWIFRYGFNNLLRLPHDWMIRISGTGQYTPDRLIPGEQFGLGGSTSVRGYEEREESWDAGFSGSTEVYTPDIAGLLQLPAGQLRLLGFFDGGAGYNLRQQPGEMDSNSLRSIGTGLRYGIGETFSFSLDWGYALDQSVQTSRGGSAFHFKGQLSY